MLKRKHMVYGGAAVAMVLALQFLLPHRMEEMRSTEVLGKLNHYLGSRPRGVALAELGDAFAWDTACAIRNGADLDAFHLQTGIAFPRELNARLGQAGAAWLLVFAKGGEAVTVTEVPISAMGDVKQDAPYSCVEGRDGFFTVLERDAPSGPPRLFVLRS